MARVKTNENKQPLRILMGKVGLDGHDRGAKVVMSALRDAGMEVIYSGLHQSPKSIVRAAIEEDVDVLGLSILSGSHNDLVPRVMAELESEGLKLPIIVGGIIPDQDAKSLLKMGVREVFTPGSRLDEIVERVARIGRVPRVMPSAPTRSLSQKKKKKKTPKKKTGAQKKKTQKKESKKKSKVGRGRK